MTDPGDTCVLGSTTALPRQPEQSEDAAIRVMVWDVPHVTFDVTAAPLPHVVAHNSHPDTLARCEATAFVNFDGPAAHYRGGGGDDVPSKNKEPEPPDFSALDFHDAEAAACRPQP